jgi:CheY-like chemotaxis protein
MRENDRPSILAVCVPGVAAELGVLDLNEILAAREHTAAKAQHTGAASDADMTDATLDSCDDSACGVDAVTMTCADSSADSETRDRIFTHPDSCLHAHDEDAAGTAGISFFHADSGKKALELLRMLHFDLLVTGDHLPDMPVSHLIRRVRAAWPWQKWAMVGSSLTTQDEIVARTLGAVAVFDAPPDWDALGLLAEAAAGTAVADSRAAPAELVRALRSARLRRRASPERGERVSLGSELRSGEFVGSGLDSCTAAVSL